MGVAAVGHACRTRNRGSSGIVAIARAHGHVPRAVAHRQERHRTPCGILGAGNLPPAKIRGTCAMPVRRGCVSLGAHRLARLQRVATLCTAGRFITGKFDGIRSINLIRPSSEVWIGSRDRRGIVPLDDSARHLSPLMDKAHARGGGLQRSGVSQRSQLTLAGWGLLRAALLEKVHYTQKMVGKLGPLRALFT